MICPRCKNEDSKYISYCNGKIYCRKCIRYGPIQVETKKYMKNSKLVSYQLDYELTTEQTMISKELLSRFKNGKNSVVKAVCGAGKTEIIYDVIVYALNQGLRVCYCTPRKTLIVETANRILNQFKNVELSMIYGDQKDPIDRQFIICTTHQLYRFNQAFDLLILDEQDAFPYANDPVLQNILYASVKGNWIILSATTNLKPDLIINKRFHGFEIPKPQVILEPKYLLFFKMLKLSYLYKKQGKPFLIFVSSHNECIKISFFMKKIGFNVEAISSKIVDGYNLIEKLRNKQLDCLVTTTILERGITIANIQVIVFLAQKPVFNTSTLIQIIGRVGRKIDYPKGDIYLLTTHLTKELKGCLQESCINV